MRRAPPYLSFVLCSEYMALSGLSRGGRFFSLADRRPAASRSKICLKKSSCLTFSPPVISSLWLNFFLLCRTGTDTVSFDFPIFPSPVLDCMFPVRYESNFLVFYFTSAKDVPTQAFLYPLSPDPHTNARPLRALKRLIGALSPQTPYPRRASHMLFLDPEHPLSSSLQILTTNCSRNIHVTVSVTGGIYKFKRFLPFGARREIAAPPPYFSS